MSRVAAKVKNADNSDPSGNAFYYGYRHRDSRVSRYGFRELPRNLTVNPYTPAEQVNKDEFRQSVENAKIMSRDAATRARLYKDFKKSNYTRFYNYCLALCRANGGQIPSS